MDECTGSPDYDLQESYRSELTAALLRIEKLEDELALFRCDPAYERVDIAEERLARARERRRRLSRLLPRVCIGAFVAMGAFALTDPALPGFVHVLAYAICIAGGFTAALTIAWMLLLAARGERPKRILELERNVRIAKGNVGKRMRVSLGAPRVRELPEGGGGESADHVAIAHGARM